MGKEGGISLAIPLPMALNFTRIPWEAVAYEAPHQLLKQSIASKTLVVSGSVV